MVLPCSTRSRGQLAALLCIMATALLGGCPATSGTKRERSKRPHVHAVVAWSIGGAQSHSAYKDNIDAITVASPAYYRVTFGQAGDTALVDWDVTNPVDRDQAREVARAGGAKLVPLVACLDSCARRISTLLAKPEARKKHIAVLLDAIKRDKTDGIFVDYEGLNCAAKDFTALIQELSAALRADNKKLGIAITEPCGVDPSCKRPGYPFDIAALASSVDYLAVMEYDYAIDGSDAVAPRDWVRRGLLRVKREVGGNIDKVFVGVPFYGRITRGLTSDTGVVWSEIHARKIQGKPITLSDKSYVASKLSYKATVEVGGSRGKLYWDDHATLASRIRLLESVGMRHIAVWRLGGEDPCAWSVIRAWQAKRLDAEVKCQR
ncbi:MAG: hypothetical protein KC503_38065 [Myxococcales bacterium]|nr:hypothetical protein [Myxococcales bacterium]